MVLAQVVCHVIECPFDPVAVDLDRELGAYVEEFREDGGQRRVALLLLESERDVEVVGVGADHAAAKERSECRCCEEEAQGFEDIDVTPPAFLSAPRDRFEEEDLRLGAVAPHPSAGEAARGVRVPLGGWKGGDCAGDWDAGVG